MLISGQLTLAECYYRSLPFNSWMMVLIGDPLYRPFKYRFDAAQEEANRAGAKLGGATLPGQPGGESPLSPPAVPTPVPVPPGGTQPQATPVK